MERRKFILGAGSATTAGLAGCIDLVQSNGDPNNSDPNSNDNNQDGGSGGNPNVELNFFTSNVNCAGDETDDFASITDPENTDNLYEFSGRMIVPSTCQESSVDLQLQDGTLTVGINSETKLGECEDQCAGAMNFAGAVFVSDSVEVNDSEINLN